MVVVDELTKISHLIPVRDTYDATNVAQVFISKVIWLHGLPTQIIFDRDFYFTYRFWTSLQSMLGNKLNLSTTCHPKIDEHSKRVNLAMEDTLKMYCHG